MNFHGYLFFGKKILGRICEGRDYLFNLSWWRGTHGGETHGVGSFWERVVERVETHGQFYLLIEIVKSYDI